MSKFITSLAALAALSACAAAAQTAPSQAAYVQTEAGETAPVSCDIRTISTQHGVRVEGVAFAGASMSGDYRLTIRKRGRSGDSDIEQGGPFEARPDAPAHLSGAEFNIARGDRLNALLILSDERGELCRRELRS